MKLACPACGSAFSLDVLMAIVGGREAVMTALQLPAPIGKLLVQYVALFRPPKRQLSLDRVGSLLAELLPMIEAARIERNGRTWTAPQDYWKQALEEMIAKRDKLTLPLKSHGYLLAIIEGYGNKSEAKQEAATEARRAGHTPVGQIPPSPPLTKGGAQRAGDLKPRSAMPASVRAALKPQQEVSDDK